MTIYILGDKTHEQLDDKSLGKMISDIANVLLYVHQCIDVTQLKPLDYLYKEYPARFKLLPKIQWYEWASQCLANYNALLELAKACCWEYTDRFADDHPESKVEHKLQYVIAWCEQNVPDLPDGEINEECKAKGMQNSCDYNPCDIHAWGTPMPWPLVMPKKYKIFYSAREIIKKEEPIFKTAESYRAYYRAKLLKKHTKIKLQDCQICKNGIAPHKVQVPAYPLPVWTRRQKPEWLGDL